jgi:2'-5' RNA ligase
LGRLPWMGGARDDPLVKLEPPSLRADTRHPSSFVALVAPDGPWRTSLLEGLPPRVRPLHPADVHVTLAFLGGVTPEAARAAFDAVAPLPLTGMNVSLGAVVPLGPDSRWTALSALIEDGGALAEVMRTVREVAARATDTIADTRPPLPHVTIARLHAKATPDERARAEHWARARRTDEVLRLDRLALYTGHRHKEPGQPAYEVIAERPLT